MFVGEKTIDGGEYVYILNTQIPEPSTWAAIFGAVALGVAVYRRRK
ncbi:MAG: PEP-CTERM sorting domain-containing protein [Candidatus Merdousia sp.]|nr:PEP-CTERM sorting domain-containing protein [Candidatus Merdousia sp.]